MKKNLPALAALFASALVFGGTPDLTVSGDGTADGRDASGNAVAAKAEQLEFVPGLRGQAIRFKPGSKLLFEHPGLLGDAGAVSMWVRADWNGWEETSLNRFLLSALNADGKQVFPFWFWNWLRLDLPRDDGSVKSVEAKLIRGNITKNDWVHITAVWNRRNWCAIYLNGSRNRYEQNMERVPGVSAGEIRSVSIGSDAFGAPETTFLGTIDEVKFYKKPLSDKEVEAEYRAFAPFDLYLDRALYHAPREIELELFRPESGRESSVDLSLVDKNGKILAQKAFPKLPADSRQTLKLPVPELPPGEYRLEAKLGTGLTRAFRITLADDETPVNAAPGELKTGKPVFEKTFRTVADSAATRGSAKAADGYLEAGSKKDDHISCILPIPPEYRNGKPLLLEIEWPDDKERMFSIYLYPEAGSKSEIRDRLGGGVAAGGIYPNSNRMQRLRYLIYGSTPTMLLELRTQADNTPAAISALRLFPLPEGLPRLELNLPDGMPGRQIGHLDEDQSFDYNLDWDNTRPKLPCTAAVPKIVRMLREYYAYTGQNSFSLPLLRYNFAVYQTTAFPQTNGVFPFENGEVPYIVETLAKDGIGFNAIINLSEPPALFHAPDRTAEFGRTGVFTRNNRGSIVSMKRCNPVHPLVRNEVEKLVEDFARRFGKLPGVQAIEYWVEWPTIAFSDLTSGYDDYTVALFSRETGVKVPEFDEQKYQRRYEFLTAPPQRDAWVKWRAAKTTEMIRRLRSAVDRHAPELPLHLVLRGVPQTGSLELDTTSGLDPERSYLEEPGIDFAAVRQIPGVVLVPMRDSLMRLWQQHWNNARTTGDETLFDPAMQQPFRCQKQNYVNDYFRYFESFSNSPIPEKYPSHFQNSDLKPHGRFFLKELAFNVGAGDAQRISFGAQPLASLGREEEMREFARAFRALPDRPFRDVAGATDPVTVRYLPTKNGTYLYLVSLIHVDTEVALEIPGARTMRDLSTGRETPVSPVTLKPFELRSFLIPGEAVPVWKSTAVPDAYRRETEAAFAELADGVAGLAAETGDAEQLAERVERCRALLKAGRYAEFHRLYHSKLFYNAASTIAALAAGYPQQQRKMLEASHIAVNCGSADFFRAPDGRLFFPDRRFGGKLPYGFDEKCTTATRNTNAMPAGGELNPLFSTEAYDLDGYRFQVKPGKYTVRLLFRVGFEPGRKDGLFRFAVLVNGKTAVPDYDLFKSESPERGYAELVIPDVEPEKGEIRVEFRTVGGSDPTARLLNAIEVVPENADLLSFVPAADAAAAAPKTDKEYVILVKGNSISRHGWNEETREKLGWARECGMAATSEANDYVHRFARMVQQTMPGKKVRVVFGTGGRPDLAVASVEQEKALRPDLILVQNGEHSAFGETAKRFPADYEKLLKALREFPGPPRIITIGIWNPRCREEFKNCTAPDYDECAREVEAAQRRISEQLGIAFVPVSPFENDPANTGDGATAGVRWHPNDNGMKCYADAVFKAFRQDNGKPKEPTR